MKAIYLSMYVEYQVEYAGQTKWGRIFPAKKIQVECLGERNIFLRRIGGVLRFLHVDREYAYFEKSTMESEKFRIAVEDWSRLLEKYRKEKAYDREWNKWSRAIK